MNNSLSAFQMFNLPVLLLGANKIWAYAFAKDFRKLSI